MILPDLLRRGPCGKVDEMVVERGFEMVNLTMVTKMANEKGFSFGQTWWLQASISDGCLSYPGPSYYDDY